jgi:acetyltransferase-like isoleucine patch superfamily enzyme
MRKRDLLKKRKKTIDFLIKISNILPTNFYRYILKLTRTFDGNIAIFIRYICLKNCLKSCGSNVAIFSNVYLLNVENLSIGDNVSIHPMCYIDASGFITIGSDVSIAHGTSLLSEEHLYDMVDVPIKDQGVRKIPTLIENNVWIGAGCRILAGSTICNGSIIAAGSVVKNIVESNSIYGGVPAKYIKNRCTE